MAGYAVTFSVVDEATKQLDAIRRRIQGVFAPIEQHQRAAKQLVDASGLKKVAEGFKGVGEAGATAFSSLARIVPVLGTITGAASVAGMAKLAESTANFARALQLNSTYIGTTSQQLQTMQNGFRIAGGNADTMTESLKNVAKTSYDAFLGRNATAAARLGQLGIALRDNNGNLRSAVDLQGDEIDAISKITDARDRETTATELGGRALFDVVEQYRLSGKSRQEAEAQAAKYGSLTKEQIDDLHQFHDAMGEVNVAFNRLAEDFGAAMAPYFTPFLQFLAALVRDHKPAVIAALGAIGVAVSALGTLFTIQLGIKAVGAVTGLTASIGTMGLSITKALGPLAALFAAYEGAKSVIADPGNLAPGAGLWKSFQNIIKGKAPWAEGYFPTDKNPLAPPPAAGTPNAGPVLDPGGNPAATPAPASPPAPARHSGSVPRAGGMRATPASYTPSEGATPATPAEGPAPAAGPTPAAGDSSFIKKQEGLVLHPYSDVGHQAVGYGHDFTAAEKQQGFATGASGQRIPIGKITKAQADDLFTADYQQRETQVSKRVGGGWQNLNANQKEAVMSYYYNTGRLPRGITENVQSGNLPAVAESLEHGISTVHGQSFAPLVRRRHEEAALFNKPAAPAATGAPAQVTGGPPVSGSVDVTVTHRNPPPGATVTATGRGDGVNVAHPRVEQQQLQNV